jgi:hypothetical protein
MCDLDHPVLAGAKKHRQKGEHNDGVWGWGGCSGEREREGGMKCAKLKISMD